MSEIASLIEHCDDDESLAKNILERLLFHYPGHLWIVQAFGKLGYVTIQNPTLSYTMGMRMILPKIVNATDMEKKIMRFGGEFLERHRISREKKAEQDQIQELWRTGRFQ